MEPGGEIAPDLLAGLELQDLVGESLGLSGHEIFETQGVASLAPKKQITVLAKSGDGRAKTFSVIARADTPEEVSYYHHGGILQYVLRQML